MNVEKELEIPDRETSEAADWLIKNGVDFDTPTFWLVASLLASYWRCRSKGSGQISPKD